MKYISLFMLLLSITDLYAQEIIHKVPYKEELTNRRDVKQKNSYFVVNKEIVYTKRQKNPYRHFLYTSKGFFKNHIATSPQELREIVKNSQVVWNKEKMIHNNSYLYTTTIGSLSGSSIKKKVTVIHGVVDSVDSSYYFLTEAERDSYEARNYHDNKYMMTVDEVYKACLDDYLIKDVNQNYLYVSLSVDNILTGCTYANVNCQDDCTRGFHYEFFEWSK